MTGVAGTGTGARWNASVAALLALTIIVRLAAWLALGTAPESDGRAYFEMAAAMAAGHAPIDQWGQHVFYSAGYPLFLTPFFALFGAASGVAIAGNLLLAGWTAWLFLRLAQALDLEPGTGLLLLLFHALWIPGIWNSMMLARENLSAPLFLLILLLAVRLGKARAGAGTALGAGLAYGAAIVTGGSALPLIAAPLLAILFVAGRRVRAMLGPVTLVAAGVAMVLVPWGAATNAMVGAPVLNSNGGFNLYLGNNPAATGRFVSITDTPAGPEWEAMRQRLGERGASAELGDRAIAYAAGHPARTATLGLRKLVWFWAPNFPDASDYAASRALAAARLVEVAQYLFFLIFAIAGFAAGPVAARQRWIVAVAVGGFWLLHAAAYIIPRYRDPVMPVLMLFAAAGAGLLWRRWRAPRAEVPHAA